MKIIPNVQLFVTWSGAKSLVIAKMRFLVTTHPVILRCAVCTEKSRSSIARFLASLEMTRWLSSYDFSSHKPFLQMTSCTLGNTFVHEDTKIWRESTRISGEVPSPLTIPCCHFENTHRRAVCSQSETCALRNAPEWNSGAQEGGNPMNRIDCAHNTF